MPGSSLHKPRKSVRRGVIQWDYAQVQKVAQELYDSMPKEMK